MAQTKDLAKTKRRGGRLAVALGRVSFCLLPWVAGCATDDYGGHDPLLGGPPIPKPSATPATPTAAPKNMSVVPPLPASNTNTSTAALAGGGFQPLDGRHDLRIGTNRGASAGGDPWRGPGSQTGVILRQPEAVNNTTAVNNNTVQVGGIPKPTYEQAKTKLAARGVLWQRLETSGESGEWKFSCGTPSPRDPNLRRTYEAKAPDPVTAMQAVIEQMDKDR